MDEQPLLTLSKKQKQSRILKPKNSWINYQVVEKKKAAKKGRIEPLQNLDTKTSQDSYPQLKNKPAESRPPLSVAAPSKLLLEANFDDELEFQKDSAILRMEIDGRNSQISELRDLNARLTSELEQVKSELAEVLDAKTGIFDSLTLKKQK